MEKERVAEAAAGATQASSSMAAPRDAAYRDAPPQSQPPPPQQQQQQPQPPSHGHSRVSSMGAPEHQQHAQNFRPPAELDLGHVITRLEQQVAFNYSMIQKHAQENQRLNDTLMRVQHEIVQIVAVVDELRSDVISGRLPSRSVDPGRYDPADVEVLANQIANVTSKVNEVDNLKVSIELMKQRLKRFESAAATPGPAPEGVVGRPEQHHYEALRPQQLQQAQGHPPQPIRPGAALSSEHGRQPGHPAGPPPVLESQPTSGFHAAHERQPNPADQAQQATRQPGFRAAEPLPPPTALSGWRPAESFPPAGGPPPPQAHNHPMRSAPEPEPQATGWAAVNLSQAAKRPLDEHHPQHDSSQPGSPKRAKLATLKPRNSFGDDHHQSPYAQPAHVEAAHQARGRIPSGDVPLQAHPQMNPAPGQAAGNSYRFITSTGQPDNQEHWRATEGDPTAGGRFEHTTTSGTGRGRGRGSRGGRRGGRGRGGRSSSGPADVPPAAPDAPHQEHGHSTQVPPEWREHQWAATQQAPSNGHYPGQHAYSPVDAARQPPPDLAVHTGGPLHHGLPYPAGHEHEFPATPIASNADPYSMANDLDSANRKTRTKPIRNSDGVLIRKDGRPDMRSVSSANNLRKVHAKKEAEKAEMEGRTPTSGRSLAPANSSSLSDDEGMEEGDYMELEGEMDRDRSEGRNGTSQDIEQSESLLRHRELMSRMFQESSARSKGTAEAWFPRVEGPPPDVKREDQENKEREARWRGMEDTTMRDTEPGGEREASQRPSERPSEQPSRERTSVEATPNIAVASEPAASEQPESETEVAAPSAPESATLSVAGEKDTAKKDSTQLESSTERVTSEPATAAAATVETAAQ